MLEAGENPPGVGYLELAVEVDLAVDRVDETVQTLARMHVRGLGDDPHLVLRLQPVELYPRTVVHRQRVERRAVQDDLTHGRRDEVQPGLLASSAQRNRTVVTEPNVFSPVVRSSSIS